MVKKPVRDLDPGTYDVPGGFRQLNLPGFNFVVVTAIDEGGISLFLGPAIASKNLEITRLL